MTAALTKGRQQLHYRHRGPGAELRDRHPRELADRPHSSTASVALAREDVLNLTIAALQISSPSTSTIVICAALRRRLSCSVELYDRCLLLVGLRRVDLNGWSGGCSSHLFVFGADGRVGLKYARARSWNTRAVWSDWPILTWAPCSALRLCRLSAAAEQAISPGLPSPMARPGCRRPPVRNGTDPRAFLLEEELEHAGRRQPVCQRGGLLVRARLPQAAQQPGHAVRVVEGGVGGGRGPASAATCSSAPASAGCPAGWPRRPGRRGRRGRRGRGPAARRPARPRPPAAGVPSRWPRRPGRRGRRGRRPGRPARRPARARPPPAGCPAGWPRRPGCRGRRGRRGRGPAARRPARPRPPPAGCPAGWPRRPGRRGGRGRRVPGQQRGGLLVRARLPQAVQQAGHGARVVEGGVGGGPGRPARRPARPRPPPAGCPAGWPRRPGCRGGRGRRPGPASAAACSSAPASRRLSSRPATASGLSRGAWAAARAGQRGGLLVRARLPQAVQQAGHAARVVEGGVGGGPAGQRGGLLVRARLPQAVQQAATPTGSSRAAWAAARASSAAACSSAPACRRPSSRLATPPGRRGGRGRRPGRPARRPARPRPPPAGCPAGWPRRPGRRGRRGRRGPGQQRGGLLVRARLPQAVQQAGHAVRVVEGGVGGGPVRGAGVRAQAGRGIG